jgi:hypothetical protein
MRARWPPRAPRATTMHNSIPPLSHGAQADRRQREICPSQVRDGEEEYRFRHQDLPQLRLDEIDQELTLVARELARVRARGLERLVVDLDLNSGAALRAGEWLQQRLEALDHERQRRQAGRR